MKQNSSTSNESGFCFTSGQRKTLVTIKHKENLNTISAREVELVMSVLDELLIEMAKHEAAT